MFGEITIFHVKMWNQSIDSQPFRNRGCSRYQATLRLNVWYIYLHLVVLNGKIW